MEKIKLSKTLNAIKIEMMMNIFKITLSISFIFIIGTSCSSQNTLQPQDSVQSNNVKLKKGDLKVTFVDNQSFGNEHRAGYNGIAKLYHPAQDSTPFVPFYAGFNFEHIFGGDSLVQLFEPRKHSMSLYRQSDNEVLLYQAATPLSGVESLTSFKLTKPHYIDITFRCIFHNIDFFKHDYAGIFWASYINSPKEKEIHFMGFEKGETTKKWISAFSKKHGENSSHISIDDENNFFFAPNFNVTLSNHFSDYKYSLPFYYGRFHNMVLAYLFDSSESEVIRFSQSPTGGGATNPAWDFQFIIPQPEQGKEYSFRARVVYKPFITREDIYEEYQSWKN